MNVVERQGFKYSMIGYAGFIMGAIATYFIFPRDFAFYGKLRFLLSTSEMLVPVVVFGVSYANVKFFLTAQKIGKQQNLLHLSLAFVLSNFIVFTVIFFLLYFIFPDLKNSQIWRLKYWILPLVLLISLSSVFNIYLILKE